MKESFETRVSRFLFAPASDGWVGILRVGLGAQVAIYCLSLRSDWLILFAGDGGGMISRDLAEAILDLRSAFIPRLGWLVTGGGFLHLRETDVLFLLWGALLGASLCLLCGLFSRTAAILAWFLYLSTVKSGNLFAYGVDNFTVIGLFYLMIAPLPDRWSWDWKRRSHRALDPARLGIHLRLLQFHLCLIYFFGGATKATGLGWWNGVSLWRALAGPPFDLVPLQFLVFIRDFLPIAGILVCLIELGYPVFIWWRKTRAIWLACVIGMHLAIGLTMGLYLFSLIMIVLNLAAFGSQLTWPAGEKIPEAERPPS